MDPPGPSAEAFLRFNRPGAVANLKMAQIHKNTKYVELARSATLAANPKGAVLVAHYTLFIFLNPPRILFEFDETTQFNHKHDWQTLNYPLFLWCRVRTYPV
jgi:hypothetical protein